MTTQPPFRMSVPLDDDEVYTGAIEVVSYLDRDGGQQYRVRFDGGMSLSATLGLLELAKMTAVAESDWNPGGE